MSNLLIDNDSITNTKISQRREDGLYISEMFSDTLQGEGITSGIPSTFIRLAGCTLDCIWCDTSAVWKKGDFFTFDEILSLLEKDSLIERLRNGQHLVLTGGSPLKQQQNLVTLLSLFRDKYNFLPYIEIENEAVLQPLPSLLEYISQWNNSPKLDNSGMKERVRHKPEILNYMSSLENSWFKFVVSSPKDWEEIKEKFLDTKLIRHTQVILMPEGQTQEELLTKREQVAEICIREGLRFSDRQHVTIWDKKTGV